jgi:hypothetical protein
VNSGGSIIDVDSTNSNILFNILDKATVVGDYPITITAALATSGGYTTSSFSFTLFIRDLTDDSDCSQVMSCSLSLLDPPIVTASNLSD